MFSLLLFNSTVEAHMNKLNVFHEDQIYLCFAGSLRKQVTIFPYYCWLSTSCYINHYSEHNVKPKKLLKSSNNTRVTYLL